jgi:hypothetical protein
MKYEVTILVEVDLDANFLGSDSDFFSADIEDLIRAVLYDVDDMKPIDVNVQEAD